MDEKKRLIRNTGVIAIGSMSTRIVSFLLLPMYTSLLSTSEYGIFDYIICICTFASPFITFLMEEAIFRFLLDCKTKQEKDQIITIGVTLVFFGLTCFSLLAIIFFKFYYYKYAVFLIVYIITQAMSSIINPTLRGFGHIKTYSLYNFLMSLCQILLNIIFIAVFRMGLFGMLLAAIISHLLVSVSMLIYMKLWNYINLKYVKREKIKELLVYSLPLIPNKISWAIINLSDRIMLMNIVGSSSSGIYAAAYKFPNLMDMLYGFFYQSWKESSARALKDDNADEFYNNVYLYLKKFLFSVVIGMIAFMPFIFKILINEKFSEALLYVPILIIATYYANLSGFYGGVFTAHKDTNIMGLTTIAAAIINITINIIAIWKFYIFAAAFSTLIANLVVFKYRQKKVKKYIILRESKSFYLLAYSTLILVVVFYYSMSIVLQCIGCVVALIYALIANKNIIINIFNFITKKTLITR